MKILVTGGAGFLGYHTVNNFYKKGVTEIDILDIADYIKEEYPESTNYYNVDVRDKENLEKVIEEGKYDIIIHEAAALPLWSKKDIYTTMIDGTRNVLDFAKKHGVKRVIYISSTAVYGVPKYHPIYENSPRVGVGAYGEAKIKAEDICFEYRKELIVPIIRPKTFIGTARLGVFQILYDWVESGTRIPVIGNGKNRYQLLEVEDLVDAIYLAIISEPEKANDTFNVGAEKFGTVREDVGALCDYAKSGSKVFPVPSIFVKPFLMLFEAVNLSPLYKWVYGTADKESFVDITKIKEKLGWQPKYSNSEALIRSYQWYLDNKDSIHGEGVTHRVGWNQGILKLFKKIL
jgi:nucleoside-diphosphate-sugar epimerase